MRRSDLFEGELQGRVSVVGAALVALKAVNELLNEELSFSAFTADEAFVYSGSGFHQNTSSGLRFLRAERLRKSDQVHLMG